MVRGHVTQRVKHKRREIQRGKNVKMPKGDLNGQGAQQSAD